MSEHTPEPWEYDESLPTTIHGHAFDPLFDSLHLLVAFVPRATGSVSGSGESSIQQEEGNRRLIAAAPELLAACEDALSKIDDCADGKINFRRDFGDRLRSAIAKATGSQ